MARERNLEGESEVETGFSDTELDADGNPIDEGEEEEEGQDGEEDEGEEDGEAEDRGDILEEEDPEGEVDVDALARVAGNGSVPRSRLNEVLGENRRLREMVESIALGGGAQRRADPPAPAAPTFDLKGKLKAQADALLEGDADKAASIGEEIEEHRNSVVRQQGEQAGRAAAAQAYQTERMNEIVNAAFKRYPFLNDANVDVFNQEALGDVLMFKQRYISEGSSESEALRKAVNRVCPHYAEAAEEEDEEERPRRGGGKSAKRDPNARNPKVIQRNARAANRIPPPTGRAGTGGPAASRQRDERDFRNISSKEFRDIPESELARLRGDFVS
jgi:hypothetical protein